MLYGDVGFPVFFFFFWEGRKIGDRFVEDRKALTMVIAAKGEEGCCCESFLPPWINTLSRNPFGISLILRGGMDGCSIVDSLVIIVCNLPLIFLAHDRTRNGLG